MMSFKKISLFLAAALACWLLASCSNQADKPVDTPIAPTQPITADEKQEDIPTASPEVTTSAAQSDTEPLDTTIDDVVTEDTAAQTAPETTEPTTSPAETEPPETTPAATTPELTTAAPETAPQIAVNPASGKMYAKSDVNVRSGAGTGYDRLGHLDTGDEVEITGLSENGWYRIVFKGSEGFVSAKYLQAEKPLPVETTAAHTSSAAPAETTAVTDKNSDKPAADNKSEDYMADIKPTTLCPDKYLGKKSGKTYGKVERKTYYSKTTGNDRPVNIVLPSDYSKDKKYPVMYVLHGIFCSENTMMDSNGTHYIIQNMMAAGEAEEMIIVFPNMYAAKDKNMQPSFGDIESVKPYDDFLKDLVNDLMPYMEKNYSVATGKDNTAIFGFSMGGRESLATGFTYPDKFGYVGAVAPAPGLTPGQDWAFKHPGQFKESELKFGDEKPYLLMVCAGDKDGTVGQFPKSYHNIMDKNKAEHIWWEIPGSDHGDPAIASGTYNFAKYAFKAK